MATAPGGRGLRKDGRPRESHRHKEEGRSTSPAAVSPRVGFPDEDHGTTIASPPPAVNTLIVDYITQLIKK